MSSIARFIEKFNFYISILAGLMILLISFFSGFEAISRTLFSSPTRWTSSISVFLMIYAVFLGSSYCFQKEGHIRIELLLDKLSATKRRYFLLAGYIISAITVTVLGWKGLELTARSFELGWLTFTTIQVPIGYINIVIPIGCLLMLLALLNKIRELTRKDSQNA